MTEPGLLAQIITALNPVILALLSTVATIAVGWLSLLLKTKLGKDIEARDREALIVALTNAAALVLNALGGTGAKLPATGLTPASPGVKGAVDYVRAAVPDALKRFGLDAKPDSEIAVKIVAAATKMLMAAPTRAGGP